MESTCHESIIRTCSHSDSIETLVFFFFFLKWAMLVHAYSSSKVEGRSQGLLASKVPMALCSIWETRLLCSGRRNRLWHEPSRRHITKLIKRCVLPQFSHLKQNVSLSLFSFHYVAQFMRGGVLRGKAQQMWESPKREMETLTWSLESKPASNPGLSLRASTQSSRWLQVTRQL